MNNVIAKELKAWRIRRGLELNQIAYDFGVSYETMRKYEKGQTNITIEFLEKMLKYYDIDIAIFFKNVCENMHAKNTSIERKT